MTYMPECLRNLPAQKSKPADAKRRKAARDLAELVVVECIQRLKAERRSKPKDWERAYSSAITVLELFSSEVAAKQWAGTEGSVVNQKFTTGIPKACACGPGAGCTDCGRIQEPRND